VLSNRGLALLKAGQYQRAIGDFSDALLRDPKDALSLYNRGVAKQKSGDEAGASVDIGLARQLDPKVGQ
jgi:Flp pilus assembly protein TadD